MKSPATAAVDTRTPPAGPMGHSRWIHEFLFSLNLMLVFKLAAAEGVWYFFSTFAGAEFSLQRWINTQFGFHPHSSVGSYAAFLAFALVAASCLFLMLRLLSRTFVASELLRSVAGLTSLIALPATWLYRTYSSGPLPGLPDPPRLLLFLELAGAVAWAILCLNGLNKKWPFPELSSVAFLALHFSFWYWVSFGGFYFWRTPFTLVFPIAGLSSTLAWTYYLGRLTQDSMTAARS